MSSAAPINEFLLFRQGHVRPLVSQSTGPSVEATMRRMPTKTAYHSGKNSWKDYHVAFELISILVGCNLKNKALGLAINLRCSVQSIRLTLTQTLYLIFESLVLALFTICELHDQTNIYLAQIHHHTRKKSVSFPELGRVIKKMAWCALSSAPSSVRHWLA